MKGFSNWRNASDYKCHKVGKVESFKKETVVVDKLGISHTFLYAKLLSYSIGGWGWRDLQRCLLIIQEYIIRQSNSHYWNFNIADAPLCAREAKILISI